MGKKEVFKEKKRKEVVIIYEHLLRTNAKIKTWRSNKINSIKRSRIYYSTTIQLICYTVLILLGFT